MFTPSILTILGVIMYLRLPMVVRDGGLIVAVGIILAAHLISVTTGLSVSSIATDKRVEAGGAYYIISRSMGLAMGGTLGLALFAGLSFSISLYIIGFSESFLRTLEIGMIPAVGDQPAAIDPNALRLCGTIVLVLLTGITFVSTSFAIRVQYLILGAIGLSLLSIFLGGSADAAPVEPRLFASPEGLEASALFGIFFPAVTGFTAGVNLSGDLKDPKRSIPIGTLAAIAVGLAVYIGLAVFTAYRIPPELLAQEGSAYEAFAVSSEAVRAGIWGATLSSALGSILGAPRILQALSLDKITPRVFGIGHGRTNEPRYALVLAFFIALAGILIGELNAVAQIVSVFFIATYGFLNLSASFEMIASPDFRPEFKIPTAIPVIGAVACAVLMIWLDLAAMLLAATLMTGLFFALKRRELQLETGDALLGVWSSVVRVGLQQLNREHEHQRNWRPNLLLFTKHAALSREPLIEFGESLIRHRGVATEFLLGERGAESHPPPRTHDDHDHEGFFHRSVPVDGDVYGTMSAVCRFHGFSGLEPNTVMIDWHDHARHPDGFASFLSTVRELDLNLLALAFDADRGFGKNEQIDLWFSYETGFLPLHLALIRFVSSSDEWRRAKLRFLAIHDEPGVSDALHRTTTQALVDSRIEAQVKVIDNSVQRRPHAEYVVEYSDKADLTVIGLADLEITPDRVDELETMVRQIGVALFVRGSTSFTVAGTTHRPHHRSPTPVPGPNRLPSLVLPSIPALAQPAARFSVAHQQIVQRFVDMALRPVFESQMSLLDDVRHAIADLYQELADEAKDDEIAANVFEDAPCRLYADLAHQLDAYVTTELPKQQASLERSIELFVEGVGPLRRSVPRRIVARRPLSDFEPHEADPAPTRRYKARRRFWAMVLQRRGIPTRLSTRRLLRFHIDHGTRQWLDHAMRDAASRSLQFSTELGQLFNTLRDSLASLTGAALDRSLTPDTVQIETNRLVRHLENFAQANQLATDRLAQRWLEDARGIQQTLASDLNTIHFRRHVRLQRRPPRGEPLEFDGFDELPSVWIQHQRLTLMRARLVPVVAEVQTRVLASVRRTRYAVRDAIDEGVFSRSQALVELLETMKEDPSPSESLLAEADFPEVVAFEPRTLDGLREELEAASASVPPEMDVITDDALSALQSDPFSEIDVVEIGLRRRFQFLVDGELVAPLRELLADVPREMSRATTNAQDVIRLVRFTLTEEASSDEGLEPVLKASVDRLNSDMSRLRQFDRSMGEQVEEHLEQVLDLTNGFALLGTVEALAQGQRRGSTLGRMGAWPRQLAAWVREALVSLAYRRSATLLLARRVQNRTDPKPSAGVLALAEAFSPDPAVIEALPSFYTQLFSTQSTLHSAFWVDREHEIDRLEQAIVRYSRGFHGAIVITGDPGAGKTALCEVAIDRLLTGRRIVRVNPPAGGSSDPAVFRRALQLELSRRGSIEDLVGGLEPGSVVVMVDAQLWWERSESGMEVLDRVSDLVERFGDQVLFIIEMASPTLRFVQQYSPFGVGALDTIECGPVDARTLKEVVLSRHNSTGLRYSLDGRRDEELSDLTVAQLFTRHFDHTDGNIGAALQSWLAHIESVDAEQLAIVSPSPLDDDAMDALDMELVALLLQLLLHKGTTLERLERVTGSSRADLQRQLAGLRRAGLVQPEKRNVIRLQPRTQHLVLRSALRRGLLP